MTGTDLCVNWTLIVPVIFEPPCMISQNTDLSSWDILYTRNIYIRFDFMEADFPISLKVIGPNTIRVKSCNGMKLINVRKYAV
jgi:hypothetical protein